MDEAPADADEMDAFLQHRGRGPLNVPPAVEDLLRELAPQVLGVLVRRYGDFDAAEDAVQEALLAAAEHWPGTGSPTQPRGWLIQTADRRLIDQLPQRAVPAGRGRTRVALAEPPPADVPDADDTLACCSCAATRR